MTVDDDAMRQTEDEFGASWAEGLTNHRATAQAPVLDEAAGSFTVARADLSGEERTSAAAPRSHSEAGDVPERGPARAVVPTPGRTASRQASEVGLTTDLARAARALAQVSLTCVAEHAELAPERLSAFERHRIGLAAGERFRLRRALEDFGVVFIPEGDQGGYGVRRRFTRAKVTRLESWENEGGPAYEDAI
jgi:hypothetical protein